MGKVLFMSHAAERTGPPIIMLHLARWLRANTDLDFELLFLQGGELEEEFARLAPVHILDEWDPPRAAVVLDSLAWKVGREEWAPRIRAAFLRRRMRAIRDVDLVYVNTCGSVRGLRYLRDRDRATVVTHVHELSVGLDYHLAPEDVALIAERSSHYIVVSEAVAEATQEVFGATPEQIAVRYGFVEAERLVGDEEVGRRHRRRLGIPDGAPVVGAAGLTHWRKAPDLFLQVARLLDRSWGGAPPHFVWVGGERDGPELEPLRYDLERTDLAGRVHFLGHQADPMPWVQAFDVLVLPAREDAFPLVCLEAAAMSVPIVCFDNGGMPEFVGDGDCGFVVPYPDLGAMADRVRQLLEDEPLRRATGERAAAKARAGHDVAVGAAGIHEELRRWH
jgi:glycosyltransferase involved in cell wall biosynthesis